MDGFRNNSNIKITQNQGLSWADTGGPAWDRARWPGPGWVSPAQSMKYEMMGCDLPQPVTILRFHLQSSLIHQFFRVPGPTLPGPAQHIHGNDAHERKDAHVPAHTLRGPGRVIDWPGHGAGSHLDPYEKVHTCTMTCLLSYNLFRPSFLGAFDQSELHRTPGFGP